MFSLRSGGRIRISLVEFSRSRMAFSIFAKRRSKFERRIEFRTRTRMVEESKIIGGSRIAIASSLLRLESKMYEAKLKLVIIGPESLRPTSEEITFKFGELRNEPSP